MDAAVLLEFRSPRFPASRYRVLLEEAPDFRADFRLFHSRIRVPAGKLVKTLSTCRCLKHSLMQAEERRGSYQGTGPKIAEAKFRAFWTKSQPSCGISTASATTRRTTSKTASGIASRSAQRTSVTMFAPGRSTSGNRSTLPALAGPRAG